VIPVRSLLTSQSAFAIAALWIATAATVAFTDAFWVTVAVSVLTWVYLCVAWNIVSGFAGQVSFGHAAFFGIGAYTSTYLAVSMGLNPWLAMLAGATLATAASLLVGYLPFRWGLSHLVFALFTLAFSYALEYGVSGVSWLGGTNGLFVPLGSSGISAFRFEDPAAYLILIGILTTIILIVVALLYQGPTGLFWRAIHDNEAAAAAAGIDTARVKMRALALSAFFTACAGTFHAQHVGFIDPLSAFGLEITVYILLFAVVGGSGTILGPVIGPVLLIPLSEFLRVKLGHSGGAIHHLIFGLALMAAILAWPGGIMAALARVGIGRGALLHPVHLPEATLEVLSRSAERGIGANLLSVEHVSKDFGGVAALRNVSIDVHQGEILGIIGPNGAGKTTLFAILSGFLSASQGRFSLQGEILSNQRPQDICARGIARTFQTTQPFPSLTVLESVYMTALVRNDAARASEITSGVLRDLGLWDRRHIISGSLTLVEHRRLEIARALATAPKILLLDEIMAGLTPREIYDAIGLIRRIRNLGITVVVIEHHVRAVMSLSDRILVLDAGEAIAIGAPAEVATNPRVLEAYLGRNQDATLVKA
jgi:branched-chain amino acid transport system permease protein